MSPWRLRRAWKLFQAVEQKYGMETAIEVEPTPAFGPITATIRAELLPRFAGPKVIYAAANRMGSRAAREGITFKQTPYALEI